MGIRTDLYQDAVAKSHAARTSSLTRTVRVQHFAGFIAFLASIGMLPQAVADIEEWTVRAYSERMQAKGLSVAHIQNVLSSIRIIFRAAGRDLVISNSNRNRGARRRNRQPASAS